MSRPVTPKRWTSILLAGTAAGATLAGSTQAATDLLLPRADSSEFGTTLASGEAGESGEGHAKTEGGESGESGETAATAEGGEAGEGGESGESGALTGIDPDAAYITRLGLVEGHLIAAQALYARGMTDAAIALSGHPEAEMMDEVRETLEERGAPDFSDALDNVGMTMAEGVPPAQITDAMARLHAEIVAAEEAADPSPRTRFEAILALTRAAANGYEGALDDGAVEDVFGYHESFGFISVARSMATELATAEDPEVAEAAGRVLTALDQTEAAYGDMISAELTAGDASLLHGAAAKVEIASLRVK